MRRRYGLRDELQRRRARGLAKLMYWGIGIGLGLAACGILVILGRLA